MSITSSEMIPILVYSAVARNAHHIYYILSLFIVEIVG